MTFAPPRVQCRGRRRRRFALRSQIRETALPLRPAPPDLKTHLNEKPQSSILKVLFRRDGATWSFLRAPGAFSDETARKNFKAFAQSLEEALETRIGLYQMMFFFSKSWQILLRPRNP